MKPIALGCIFWTVQFVNIYIVASRTLGSDDSCPCVPSTKCSVDVQLVVDKQVLILPCESRDLVRCCSTVPRSIESARAIVSPWDSKNTLSQTYETETVSTELNIPTHIEDSVEEDETTESRTNVPFLEVSTWDIPVNIHEAEGLNDEDKNADESKTATSANSTDESTEMTQNVQDGMGTTDVNQVPLHHPRTESPPASRLVEIQKKKLSNSRRTVSSTASKDVKQGLQITKKGRLASPVQLFQLDEGEPYVEDLIREVRVFESRRTAPRRPDLLLNTARRINFVTSKAVVLNKSYFNTNLRVLPTAKSTSEKVSDLVKQKTLLETVLTPDGVSAQAINENASSVSELDMAQRDDTSIRNLSHPEDIDDVKRVARSHASEPNEEPKGGRTSKSLSSRAKKGNQMEAEAASVKPFKRPPRVLPVRHLSKEENDSNKFANSRERAISLFNKSNEARRKQVSLLANRNDSTLTKTNSSKSNSTTSDEIETGSSLDGKVNLLIKEKFLN
ncbi:uncharacterized protein LOC117217946 [Megalopta genalis]|uniref:uncharacterized protein LOC117217946 n=1 Tax=Megalopta genalis TaxID=115081 RepID=UPI003FD3C8AF